MIKVEGREKRESRKQKLPARVLLALIRERARGCLVLLPYVLQAARNIFNSPPPQPRSEIIHSAAAW